MPKDTSLFCWSRTGFARSASTIDEAAKAIGYSRNMVLRHVQKKHIYAVKVGGRWVVAKSGLVAFLATDGAFRIREKSKWHERVVRRCVGENGD
jgi:excisionase family DNA binding protein